MPPLRIYTDENVDVRVAEGLRRRGIEARTARDEGRLGDTDDAQVEHAARIGAVIFTHDHDIVTIALERTARGRSHCGVIFVAQNRLTLGECVQRLAVYAEILEPEEIADLVEFL